jgi:hypothetical protein
MVQVINTGNPNSKISEMLGLSLGQGLSNGINSFYANRALENVLSDKALSNSSFSEKMGALQKALSPYGEVGQNILNQRLQVEAQAYQERQAKEQARLAKEKEERLYAHQKSLERLKAVNQGFLEDKKQTGRESLEGIKFGNKQNLEENKFYRESQFKEGEQGRLFEHQRDLQEQKDIAAGGRQRGLFGHQTGLQTQKDIAAANRQQNLFGHQSNLENVKFGHRGALDQAKFGRESQFKEAQQNRLFEHQNLLEETKEKGRISLEDLKAEKRSELEKEKSKLKSDFLDQKAEKTKKQRLADAPGFKKTLMKLGFSEDEADAETDLYVNAPVGGQTEQLKRINDRIKRKGLKVVKSENPEIEVSRPKIEIPGMEGQGLELDFPELPEPIGLTPSEQVRQNEYREKQNSPLYAEVTDRVNALDEEYRDISYLQELDEIPGALPSGVEKWNVDWNTGDLRLKALATPEAQAYVKTIARMARKAKEFFPGRVTNFDLDQFKQGFATLANSKAGRQLINQQLATANRIAYLKDETLKAAIEHYGSGADPVLIKKAATENYRGLKGHLENQLKQINQQAALLSREQANQIPKERPSLDEIFK